MPNYKVGIELEAKGNAAGVMSEASSAASNLGNALPAVLGFGAAVGGAVAAAGVAVFNYAQEVDKATDQIGASLGLAGDAAQQYGNVIKSVYANNFGDSIADVGTGVEEVAKRLELAADSPALPSLVEKAFALRDVFDKDLPETVGSARTLMDNFGLSGEQSMDFITAGFQRGLNKSDDLLDTLGEYSNQFAGMGFSAEQFFSILETGSQGGVLGTDKIADAIKEMSLILNEGGDDVRATFSDIGLDFEQIEGFIRSGDETWADYFDNIVAGINGIEDPVARAQAQVAIFGTMAEDLGPSFTEGLTAAGASMKDMEGAADSLNTKYTNLGSFFEGLWRTALTHLSPFGEALLNLGIEALPAIQGRFNSIAGSVQTSIGWMRLAWDANLGGMRTKAEEFMTLDKDFERFWGRVNATFDQGETDQSEKWATWLGNMLGGFGNWMRLVLDIVGTGFEMWQNTQNAWQALWEGDWQTFWGSIGENFQRTFDGLLGYLAFVFGPGVSELLNQTFGGIVVELQATWAGIVAWWEGIVEGINEIRESLGLGSSQIAVPVVIPGGGQQIPIGGGGASAQALAGAAVYQTFYIERGDAETVATSAELGVTRAQRALGQ